MNEISDERLKELLLDCRRDGSSVVAADISEMEAGQIVDELLSLRSLNKRLVENSKALAKSLESEYYDCDNEPCALAYHRELLAELEGNKFESAMKRVLDENKGAWKALGGEEGKG